MFAFPTFPAAQPVFLHAEADPFGFKSDPFANSYNGDKIATYESANDSDPFGLGMAPPPPRPMHPTISAPAIATPVQPKTNKSHQRSSAEVTTSFSTDETYTDPFAQSESDEGANSFNRGAPGTNSVLAQY